MLIMEEGFAECVESELKINQSIISDAMQALYKFIVCMAKDHYLCTWLMYS